MDQLSLASFDYAAKKKRTKRHVFLAEMVAVVPWVPLKAVVEPYYPKTGPQGGQRPFPLPVMLRIYCLQQWYGVVRPGCGDRSTTLDTSHPRCSKLSVWKADHGKKCSRMRP